MEYIPYLTKFIFTFIERIDKKFKVTPSHALINQFISPFWSYHQWKFRTLINPYCIVYSIRPHIEDLFDFQEFGYVGINSNKNVYPRVQMYIPEIREPNISHIKIHPISVDKISPLLEIIDVTRSFIQCHPMNSNMFIGILNLLPNIDLLTITVFSSPEKFFCM